MSEPKQGTPIYTMLYRPVSSFTLPAGITTEWVRLPQIDGHVMARAFPHLERSEHPYGEFTASRELAAEELERFQVRRVDPEFVRSERLRQLDERIETLQAERTMFASDPDEVTALDQRIDEAQAERDSLAAETAEATA